MALSKIRLRQDMGNILKGLHANFGWARPKLEACLGIKTRTVGINYGVGIGHIYRFLASLLHFVSQLRCEIITKLDQFSTTKMRVHFLPVVVIGRVYTKGIVRLNMV